LWPVCRLVTALATRVRAPNHVVRQVNAKVLKDFLKNVELAAINKVLGLQFGTEYTPENVGKLLRYDHFVIFCDQDPDGAHIAGELINYFTIMFPSLLRAKPGQS
jgi:DNA gyrase/topoisomerase IV subunit B